METLKINEEQKQKLIEICKELFPEYKVISFDDTDNFGKVSFLTDDSEYLFHWFELCMFQIPKKMCDGEFFIRNWLVHNLTENKIHPVDYLYKRIKKIENKVT